MTGIDISPNMMDRAADRGYFNILAVGNTESVVLLPAAADPTPALKDPAMLTAMSRWSASTPMEAEA